MPRLGAGPGVVRCLVGRHSRGVADLLRRLIHVGGKVFVRQAPQAPTPEPIAEGRPVLDGQLIKRQVVDRHRQRLGQFRPPVDQRLVLPGVDQVEAHAIEMRPCDIEGDPRLGDRVQSAKPPKVIVAKRLYPHRHPVDPGVGIALEPHRLDRGRVRLERDFRIVRHRPCRAHLAEDRRHEVGGHEAWCSPAEEYRAQNATTCFDAEALDLGKVGTTPAEFVDLCRDMAVEIAVRTLRLAEGPVDVEAESGRRPGVRRQAPSPACPGPRPCGSSGSFAICPSDRTYG